MRRPLAPPPSGWLAAFVLIALVSDARATDTWLRMTSDPGDYIGLGQSWNYTPAQGSFTLTTTTERNLVTAQLSPSGTFWTVNLASTNPGSLVPGVYLDATRYPFQDASDPGLSVYGDGRGCNQLTGDFRVKRAQYSGATDVTTFWATFEQHCEGSRPALRGDLRWNVDAPVECEAPIRVSAFPGEPLDVTVRARHASVVAASLAASALPVGASFAVTGPDVAHLTWTPGAGDQGRHLVTFVATDSAGRADTIRTALDVTGATRLEVWAEPGEVLTGGGAWTVDASTHDVGVTRNYELGVRSTLTRGTPYEVWSLEFVAPGSVALVPGFYGDARTYSSAGNTTPEMLVSRSGGAGGYCSSPVGEFEVKRIQYGTGSTIDAFWIRFAQRCTGSNAWLTGEWRYNVSPAIRVIAPMRIQATAGRLARLPIVGQASSGATVSLSSPGAPPGAAFVPGAGDTVWLEWTPPATELGPRRFAIVGTAGGDKDSSSVTFDVAGTSRLAVTSEPGDPVGGGASIVLDSAAGSVFTAQPSGDGVGVDVVSTGSSNWSLDFDAPTGSALAVGAYFDATFFPGTASAPGLRIQRNYDYCSTLSGNFRVRQLELSGLTVRRLWVDFEQRCNGSAGGLQGDVRFNASVPVEVRAPLHRTLPLGVPTEFTVTGLAASGAPASVSAVGLPAGATLVPVAPGVATFRWTPGVSDTGTRLVTFLATDGANTDTVRTRLAIGGRFGFALSGEAGAGLGEGSWYEDLSSASFSPGTPYGGGVSMTAVPRDGSPALALTLSPASGSALAPGFYENAFGQTPGVPAPLLVVSRGYNSCYEGVGRFEVKEIAYSGAALARLWVRFLTECSNGGALATGEVRYNARVPVVVTVPYRLRIGQGEGVSFGIKANEPLGRPIVLSATRLPPGASFVDHGDGTGSFVWDPGPSAYGTYGVVFHALNADGAADSSLTELVLEGRTRFVADSDSGDVVGHGAHYDYTPQTAVFGVSTSSYDGLRISVNPDRQSPYGPQWTAWFALPNGAVPTPGVYRDARSSTAVAGHPRITVYGPQGSCFSARGQFRVRRIEFTTAGRVRSAWVDFDQFCTDQATAGLHGSLLYHVNAWVVCDAPVALSVAGGAELRVPVRGSQAAGGAVTLSVLDAPTGATFSDRGDGTGEMVWTPAAEQVGLHYPRFVATDALGVRDTVTTELRVTGLTQLVLLSDSGDPAGGGQHRTFADTSGTFRLVRNGHGGVSAVFTPEDGADPWSLDFAAPDRAPLVTGTYTQAMRYPFEEFGRPGLFVTDGATCATVLGQFEVKYLAWGHDAEVASFWATFEQHCNGITPALRGELRYNLDVAVPVQLALVSVSATSGAVALEWFAGGGDPGPLDVERRTTDGAWSPRERVFADGAGHVRWTDRDVVPGVRYGYRLVRAEGGGAFGEGWVEVPVEARLALEGARPNPVTGPLDVGFSLPEAGVARLALLDVAGRAVESRPLRVEAGRHLVRLGEASRLRAGVYVIRLEFGGRTLTRTAVVVR